MFSSVFFHFHQKSRILHALLGHFLHKPCPIIANLPITPRRTRRFRPFFYEKSRRKVLSVEASIRDGLEDVFYFYVRLSVKVGYGPRYAQYLVVGARRERQTLEGVLHHFVLLFAEAAELAYLRRRKSAVKARLRSLKALLLNLAGAVHALQHALRRFGRFL